LSFLEKSLQVKEVNMYLTLQAHIIQDNIIT